MADIQSNKSKKDNIDFGKIYSPYRLKMFDQCPQQYYLSYIDPVFKPMKSKLSKMYQNVWKFQILGKATHDAITLFYHLPPEERTEANLLLKLRNTWRSEAMPFKKPPLGKWGGFKTEDEEREAYRDAQAMLRNFYQLCEKEPDIAFLPTDDLKRSIEDYKNLITHLNDNFDISGKFDLIIKTGDRLHIIDFKTGKGEERDNFQLRFYKLLAEQRFKIHVETVSFYYLRTGHKADFAVQDLDLQEIKGEIVRRIEQITTTKTFEPRPSKLCNYCLYKTFCPAKAEVQKIIGNGITDEYPEDLPF